MLFNFIFSIFPIVFIGIFILTIVTGVREWSSNKKMPILSVIAKLIDSKKTTSTHNNNGHLHTDNNYYLIFEVESGDRLDFKVSRQDYKNSVVGDIGKLTFQGTKYISFNRNFEEE